MENGEEKVEGEMGIMGTGLQSRNGGNVREFRPDGSDNDVTDGTFCERNV